MTAMVGPVSINHFDFRNRRVALFAQEVILTDLNVVQIHRQPVFRNKRLQSRFVQTAETVQHSNLRRDFIFHIQRVICLKRSLPCLNGIDNIFLDFLYFLLRQFPIKQINPCCTHKRTFLF